MPGVNYARDYVHSARSAELAYLSRRFRVGMTGDELRLTLLAGCALGRDCSGPAGEVEQLRCAASAGDKHAQLALGIRYETGEGVPRDLKRAEEFYARAARAERRPAHVYSPAVGKERHGGVIPVGASIVTPGLGEARRRLEALRQARATRR